jgi:hypothetical protein
VSLVGLGWAVGVGVTLSLCHSLTQSHSQASRQVGLHDLTLWFTHSPLLKLIVIVVVVDHHSLIHSLTHSLS